MDPPGAVRVPTEVLSEIIFILYEGASTSNPHGQKGAAVSNEGFAAPWITTTWVCRRWREAALQRGALWTSLRIPRRYIRYPEAVHTFFNRAPEGTVVHADVRAMPDWWWPGQTVTENAPDRADVLEHLLRWRHRLDLGLSTAVVRAGDADISGLLGALGSTLSFLGLGARGYHEPFALDVQGLPNLEHLMLNCVPSVNAPLPGITYIVMYTAIGLDVERIGCLQTFLSACPDLTTLNIFQSLPPHYGAQDPSHLPVVHLPQLTLLSLHHERTDAVYVLLETLRLPPSAKLTLQLEETSPNRARSILRDDGWLRDVLPRDQDNFPGILLDTHNLLVFMDNEFNYEYAEGPQPSEGLWFCVVGYSGEQHSDDQSWSLGGVFHGGVPVMARPRSLGRFLHGLPLIVRPALIRRLDLHLGDWLFAGIRRQSLWRELLGQFPALRELVLGGWECIEAVTRTLEADPTLLLQLKSINMCINGLPAHAGAAAAMTRWLAVRRAAGSSLETLSFDTWTGVSLETTALVNHLTSEATQHGMVVRVVPRDFCEACQRPARVQDSPSTDADMDADRQPGAAAEERWEWGKSDGEESESDTDTQYGFDDEEVEEEEGGDVDTEEGAQG